MAPSWLLWKHDSSMPSASPQRGAQAVLDVGERGRAVDLASRVPRQVEVRAVDDEGPLGMSGAPGDRVEKGGPGPPLANRFSAEDISAAAGSLP